jgi:hypothetical protein
VLRAQSSIFVECAWLVVHEGALAAWLYFAGAVAAVPVLVAAVCVIRNLIARLRGSPTAAG